MDNPLKKSREGWCIAICVVQGRDDGSLELGDDGEDSETWKDLKGLRDKSRFVMA